ncbi:hypothetical protein A5320_00620 [Rheinheimera sp. SA_1]|uniref:enolase C-terminal domain-like protein n=1 Tax=Rheinheimera sp. SA_1 TaxID=1827365 RepID=UPI0007FC654D|nr:enolase C-terminal domain-like protein [Rheinheimera sp. SA_1]OBP15978.1 hypothetical protein A5320_00620 [Rheinheimera sp. SA_1]
MTALGRFHQPLVISHIQLHQIHIPFVLSFNHATHQRAGVTGIVLQLTSACGKQGYGEVLPRDYVSGETHQSVVAALSTVVLPALVGRHFTDVIGVLDYLQDFYLLHPTLKPDESCVRTAVDLALLDLAGHCLNQPLAPLLAAAAGLPDGLDGAVLYSGTYGISQQKTLDVSEKSELGRYQRAYQALQLQQFKLKVGCDLDSELALLRHLQHQHPHTRWRVDANGAWTLQQARQAIPALLALGVESIEQPLAAADRHGYLALFAELATGCWLDRTTGQPVIIMLDESCCRFSDISYLLEAGYQPALNLRVSKCGGIWSTLQLALQARQHGLRYQLGAQVGETAILTRAGQVVAALLADCVYHEGAFGDYLLCQDLQQPSVKLGDGGWLSNQPLLTEPGLAVVVSPVLLDQYTSHCSFWDVAGRHEDQEQGKKFSSDEVSCV